MVKGLREFKKKYFNLNIDDISVQVLGGKLNLKPDLVLTL